MDVNPLLVLLAIAAVIGMGVMGGPAAAFGVAVLFLLAFIAERVVAATKSKD